MFGKDKNRQLTVVLHKQLVLQPVFEAGCRQRTWKPCTGWAYLKQVLQGFCFIIDYRRCKALHNDPIFAILDDGNVRGLSTNVQQVIALLVVYFQVADAHSAG